MTRLYPWLLCASLAASACGGDDDDPAGNGPDSGPVDDDVVTVAADIESDTTWTADRTYRLERHVFVRGATLTIEAGTTIVGDDNSSLVVTATARLDAAGTADAPIVFTSSRPEGGRSPGDWGGVVLLGRAPINVAGGENTVEGFPAGTAGTEYGGDDDAHDCGTLRYARIEFAGFELSADNELNGLTVAACGTDTELDHIQVHKGADDGVEFFGGTALVTHLLITQPDDDGLDWDLGWTGGAQWLVIQQNAVVGNYAFESDSNGNDHDATPRSHPTIWNATLIGSGAAPGEAGKTQGAMMLRRGTAATIRNAVIAHFADHSVDVADHATVEQALAGELSIESSYFFDNAGGDGWPEGFDVDEGAENDCETPEAGCTGFDEAAHFSAEGAGNVFGAPQLEAPLDLAAPSFSPAAGSPVLSAGATPGARFDASATHIGAIGDEDWTVGWTAYPAN